MDKLYDPAGAPGRLATGSVFLSVFGFIAWCFFFLCFAYVLFVLSLLLFFGGGGVRGGGEVLIRNPCPLNFIGRIADLKFLPLGFLPVPFGKKCNTLLVQHFLQGGGSA